MEANKSAVLAELRRMRDDLDEVIKEIREGDALYRLEPDKYSEYNWRQIMQDINKARESIYNLQNAR